ncbi:MFS transporter [Ureibacillus composti]
METHNQIFTKRFNCLFLMNMAVFLSFYSLMTTLPLYAIGALKQSDQEAGLLATVFLLSAIIVRPFSGKMLDMFGKKRLLIISLVFYFLCSILYIMDLPFTLLLVLRFFHGIWFSIITTAGGSLAADIVPVNRKGTGLGYYTMSNNLAVVLGPFIGILLIQHLSFDVLFSVLSIAILIGGILASTIKTDDLTKPEKVERSFKFTFNDLFEKKALPISVIAGLVGISYASILSFLSIYAEEQDLLTAASWFYVIYAAAMLITRPLIGKLYDQKGSQYVIMPGFLFYILGLICIALANGSAILFLSSAVLVGAGYGALTTSFQSLAVQSADHVRSGYATATYFTLFDLGIALGSYVLGLFVIWVDYDSIYSISALLMAVTACIYFVLFKKSKRKHIQSTN